MPSLSPQTDVFPQGMPAANVCAGVLTVDLDALARNYHRVQKMAAPAECGAVVKADAYGLGMAPVAGRLFQEGCRRYFVATVPEGRALRRVLPEAEIYVLAGVTPGSQHTLLDSRLVPVLNTLEQVAAWAHPDRRAVLHVDTGMNRLGLSAADLRLLGVETGRLRGMKLDYLMTHLACADEPAHPQNRRQLASFAELRHLLPLIKTSIGNSACVLMGQEWCGDLVRPGIGLYGGNPCFGQPNPFDVVATLEAEILQLRYLEPPQCVGYGADFQASGPMRIATLGLGYADGYPRVLSNRGTAIFGGFRLPVVGRISMDLITLDVSAVPSGRIAVGDRVELFGAHMPLENVAQAAGTVNYELLTRIGARVHREYRGRL